MKRVMLAVMAAGAMIAPAATPAYAVTLSAAAAVTGHKVAKCIYARRPADVVAALGTTGAAEYQRYYATLSRSPQCREIGIESAEVDGAAVIVPADILRGMLAEQALAGATRFRGLQPVQGAASYQRPWFAATGRDATVDEMAVCTVEQNPSAVRMLIDAKPEGNAELEAIRGLSATLGACLPQGATLAANRQSLRAALADALYQRAIAPALASK
jgi:hypothetical protein